MKKYIFLFILFLIIYNNHGYTQTPAYLNPSLSIEARVNDLISRMTLEEKVGQMLNSAPAIERLNIPPYDWWNECLHGVARTKYHTTSYP
ncbi:MAG: glycosyl hydrolase, partial [Ginsengibacter sp.]